MGVFESDNFPASVQTGGGVFESNYFPASVHTVQFESELDSITTPPCLNRDWIQTGYHVLRLGNYWIQIPPTPCLNPDPGGGGKYCTLCASAAKILDSNTPPPCLNPDLHRHTDIHYGDCTKHASH